MTTHFTSHFRRPIGVLAGLALLASLLVAAPGPIKAQDPEPDYLASFEACPEDVIPDADFSDVSSRHENAEDIDCIAYYGITRGTSATTYSPEDPVIREHMALFLVRLARLVGIRVPRASSTPFTDIADLNDTSQEAINHMYQLGITIGATATTYAPARNVSRGEMALFLQRLMDLMDPVVDGSTDYGYIPEDVDDNINDVAVESPFSDLDDESVTVYDAVTQLYELGVASGFLGSDRFYRPSEDMSRAAMAEFMAAILDHSHLRPAGVMVQVSPTSGLDNFDIDIMISVRDANFLPREDQPVDWFYTDDPDGGLLGNGTCDDDLILNRSGCVWEEDDDDTDDDGNIFVDRLRATPGETMTFYAWIGRRDGDDFDEDTATFSTVEAMSVKGASSILLEHDIPANAARLGRDEAFTVDLDSQSSVEFTIQLRDEDGNALEMEGVEIEIEVESTDVLVNAADVDDTSNEPIPAYQNIRGGDDFTTATLLTDRDGEAIFELDAPRRFDRLDEVLIRPDCDCDLETISVAWSTGDPVLVAAKPEFDLYQYRSGSNIRFTVEYNLYDQYGTELRSTSASQTGRTDTEVNARLAYDVYEVDGSGVSTTLENVAEKDIMISRGRITHPLSLSVSDSLSSDHFILLQPSIFSDSVSGSNANNDGQDPDEVIYIDSRDPGVGVWIVRDAASTRDLPGSCVVSGTLRGDTLDEVDVNVEEREFRTCFTIWSYDSNDRFLGPDGTISIDEFEKLLADADLDLTGIGVTLYSTRSSGLSVFEIK